MTNPLLLITAALVVLGLGELAALLGILFRYAIPRAPRVFHILLFVPMVTASASCFAFAWMALAGERQVAGIDVLVVLTIYFICEGATMWLLVIYSIYWHLKGRHCRA